MEVVGLGKRSKSRVLDVYKESHGSYEHVKKKHSNIFVLGR